MEPLKANDPRQVGRYRLEARLGSGGMGRVYLGFSPAGRAVAVKVIRPELGRDLSFRNRFRQEVAAARRVGGGYTAPVVDASGDDDDPSWLATTLVAGPSLAEAVEARGPLAEVAIWRLAAGLVEALTAVHAAGLVHRDLKPSNVMLAPDGPRVIDFGISRALEGTALTGTGMVVGTPGFMSPEQAEGAPVGPPSDVFSLGGVLCFAATGAAPFGEGGAVAMIYRIVHTEPALGALTGPLREMLARCLSKRPGDRPGLARLMEVITAHLAPMTSAVSFWPAGLAELVGSYQARFVTDAPPPPPAIGVDGTSTAKESGGWPIDQMARGQPASMGPPGQALPRRPSAVGSPGPPGPTPPETAGRAGAAATAPPAAWPAAAGPAVRDAPAPVPPGAWPGAADPRGAAAWPGAGRAPASPGAPVPTGAWPGTADPRGAAAWPGAGRAPASPGAPVPPAAWPGPADPRGPGAWPGGGAPVPGAAGGAAWQPPASPAAMPAASVGSAAPGRPRRRTALIMGGVLAVLVAAGVVLASPISPLRNTPRGPGTLTKLNGTDGSEPTPGGFGSVPAETGTPHPGTVSFAEPRGSTPSWILPITTVAADTYYSVLDFNYEMWRPLYWMDEGVTPRMDPALSLARAPAWSDGDRTVTVTLNAAYHWSDGQPVTSRDVVFAIDLIKAAVKDNITNWDYYVPGSFPDDVASMTTPSSSTLVISLTSAVNPAWFDENYLAVLPPMPAHAWARASAGGPILDFTVPANAQKIYDYLAAQSKATGTWAANPLWQVVDGPYRLTSFDTSTGASTLSANPHYSGPDSHEITAVRAVPVLTNTDELNAVKAGQVDVGYIPIGNTTIASQVKGGYDVFGYPSFLWSNVLYNFKDPTGDFDHIIAQLYVRQAIAHLQDEPDIIKSDMGGAGGPAYGPVPAIPVSPYTPADARTNPYPFSVAAARSLLASHGWTVTPGGTDSCARPGRGAGQCGAGIPAGTRLAFELSYAPNQVLPGELSQLAAQAKQAGITITLQLSDFTAIVSQDDDAAYPGNASKWAMADYGEFTLYPYPTTWGDFNSGGQYNLGGYSDPEADKLISASVRGSDPDAVRNEISYLTRQQPALFEPNSDVVSVWKKTLSGPPGSFASLTQFYFTPELWYYTN